MYSRFFWLLSSFNLGKFLIIFFLIQTNIIGLGPDEAQYWTWSKNLDLGYYSKPPGIAWQIWLTSTFFGDNELGVRLGASFFSFLSSLAMFGLARACCLKPIVAFWAGMIFAFTPLGMLGSLLAITDGGMLFFWILALWTVVQPIQKDQSPNYFWTGCFILWGALFKWPIYLLWILVVGQALLKPKYLNKTLVLGIAISLLGLVPSFIWNSQHDWVTFRHVLATVQGGSHIKNKASGNFWAFLGEQFFLLSPVLFIMLVVGYLNLPKKNNKASDAIQWCGWSSMGILCCYLGASIFQKIQGNWCIFAYPMAIIYVCWYASEKKWSSSYYAAGLGLSLLLCFSLLSIPYVQANNLFASLPISYKLNLFRHNVGWNQLTKELASTEYNPNTDFLFGHKYQTVSILSFYGPQQKRAYFFNLENMRKNQFCFWPCMQEERIGHTGYFVITENNVIDPQTYKNLVNEYFEKVELVALNPIYYSYQKPVKWMLILKCCHYNGKKPVETLSY